MYDTETEKYERYEQGTLLQGIKRVTEATCICGHNIIGYDIPAIKKLYPEVVFKGQFIDTLLLSKLAFPEIGLSDIGRVKKKTLPPKLQGKYSLESWGYRLGVLKDTSYKEKEDAWLKWTPAMSDYCLQDVVVTLALFQKMPIGVLPEDATRMEHDVAELLVEQKLHGFLFDRKKAETLYIRLSLRRNELTQQLKQVFPSWFIKIKEFTPKRDNKRLGYVAGCPLSHIKLTEFNPSSRHHIALHMKMRYGWKPTEYTDNGTPKIDEEVLSDLIYPEAKLLTEYLMLEKRLGQIADGKNGWLKMVTDDGRIHGDVNTMGAVSRRMTHNKPNIAQTPAVKNQKGVVPYGADCRELFYVPTGYKLVGIDASGLELRCLAHYMAFYDEGVYAREVLSGDIHTMNQLAAGLPSRDIAKRFIYAYLYGAGDELIGALLGKGAVAGRKIKAEFLAKTPALAQLKTDLEAALKQRKGFIKSLDGVLLYSRSAHSILNLLLQSCGAIVMKRALVIFNEKLKAHNIKPVAHFVANVHDEWQLEVKEEHAELTGKLGCESIREAGEYYQMRCPLDGEYKVGNNWKETH